MLWSTLAFPDPSESDRRRSAAEALCREKIRAERKADPADSAEIKRAFPEYPGIELTEIKRSLRGVHKRIKDRMSAAHMARGYLDEALRGMFASLDPSHADRDTSRVAFGTHPTPLPEFVGSHSLDRLSICFFPGASESALHHLEQRVWRASVPVIHLATAIDVIGRRASTDQSGFKYKLDDLSTHLRVLSLAGVHGRAIRWAWENRHSPTKTSTFNIDYRRLISFQA